jgi:uncharacterized protein YndB with AHSA1/START domain
MKILKGLLVVVVALVALFLVIGLFLPKNAHVERSIATTASPDAVYGIVSGFRRFNEWSPWAGLDPQARYTFSGPATGVGARMEWSSDKPEVGSGSQEITAVEPGRSVTMRLDFAGQSSATSTMVIEPAAGGSLVRWSFDTSYESNFAMRYLGLLFDGMIGADYEKGLSRLKSLAEDASAAPAVPALPSAQ